MRNQRGVSIATGFAFTLPHRLKLVSVALSNLLAKGNVSAQRQLPVLSFEQAIAGEKGATESTTMANEVNMRADELTGLPFTVEVAPLQHLFLLDMKIGR